MGLNDFAVRREKRRQAEEKKKQKVRRLIKDTYWDSRHLAEDPAFVGKMAHTPCMCSGRCCGNPRCHYRGKNRLTLQEIKELEREKDEIGSGKSEL